MKDNLYCELENEDAFRLNAPETLPTEPKVFPQLNRRKKKRKSKKQAAPPSGEVTAMAPRISVDLGVADEGNTIFSFQRYAYLFDIVSLSESPKLSPKPGNLTISKFKLRI